MKTKVIEAKPKRDSEREAWTSKVMDARDAKSCVNALRLIYSDMTFRLRNPKEGDEVSVKREESWGL